MGWFILEVLVHLVALIVSAVSALLNREDNEDSGERASETSLRGQRIPEGFALTCEGQGQRCPYCHDGLSGTLLACETCRTPFHAECCRELRRCTTVGCGGTSELPASERPLEIRLRPRSARIQVQARRRSA